MNDGGQAFPKAGGTINPRGDYDWPELGMTLRDYFAAKALPKAIGPWGDGSFYGPEQAGEAARIAYAYADAMIAARTPKSPAPSAEVK